MSRWNFEWWHALVLYAALIIVNAVFAIIEKEIGFIGAYLIIFVLVVSAQVFYYARKKNATTQEGSAMDRWNFEWRHALVLYAALIVTNAVFAIIEERDRHNRRIFGHPRYVPRRESVLPCVEEKGGGRRLTFPIT